MQTTLNKKTIAKAVVAIILLVVAFNILLPSVTSPEFKNFVIGLGVFAPLAIIIYTVASHVFAPIAGSPGIVLSIAIFGLNKTLIYLYVASLISASFNFWISRKFGRKWVVKFVGNTTMSEIDEFTKLEGKRVLWISRVLGFTLFEIISYAYGLTNIRFKEFFLITMIGSIPSGILMFLIFRNTNFESTQGLLIWLASLFVTGAVFAYFVKKYIKNASAKIK
jgi:uncharacterized membrane protein YdjX (TVP38/TMEM64 family)